MICDPFNTRNRLTDHQYIYIYIFIYICLPYNFSSQILKPAEKKQKYSYGALGSGRPVTPPRGKKKKEMAKVT